MCRGSESLWGTSGHSRGGRDSAYAASGVPLLLRRQPAASRRRREAKDLPRPSASAGPRHREQPPAAPRAAPAARPPAAPAAPASRSGAERSAGRGTELQPLRSWADRSGGRQTPPRSCLRARPVCRRSEVTHLFIDVFVKWLLLVLPLLMLSKVAFARFIYLFIYYCRYYPCHSPYFPNKHDLSSHFAQLDGTKEKFRHTAGVVQGMWLLWFPPSQGNLRL